MKFEAKEVTLKGGKSIVIREGKVSDAADFIETATIYIEESEYIPYVKGEYSPILEEQEKLIQSLIDEENSIILMVIYDGKIIGNIDVHENKRQMMNHTAGIGMGMLKEWRNMGLGTILMNSVIDWAKANPKLEQLWLEAFATNEIGIAMYKKCGFVEIGRHPNFFKIGPNKYVDEIKMNLNVL